MRRFFPFPILAGVLAGLWLLLNQSVSPGQIVLGLLVGFGAAWAFSATQPEPLRIRRPSAVALLLGRVLVDIISSSLSVAKIILFRRKPGANAGFLVVPLTLRNRYGLAALACIVTATPGTLWVSYDPAKGAVLLHVLDLVDADAWTRLIQNRYECLLREIFE